MAIATVSSASEPLGEINTTPLIDVMLVLLIMIIMTIPVGTHSIEVPLPEPGPGLPTPDRVKNKVVLTRDDAILWNGGAVSRGELLYLLQETTRFPVEPELQFEPEANASYDLAAKVLAVIEESDVTKYGFVGNERYRVFSKAG